MAAGWRCGNAGFCCWQVRIDGVHENATYENLLYYLN